MGKEARKREREGRERKGECEEKTDEGGIRVYGEKKGRERNEDMQNKMIE